MSPSCPSINSVYLTVNTLALAVFVIKMSRMWAMSSCVYLMLFFFALLKTIFFDRTTISPTTVRITFIGLVVQGWGS